VLELSPPVGVGALLVLELGWCWSYFGRCWSVGAVAVSLSPPVGVGAWSVLELGWGWSLVGVGAVRRSVCVGGATCSFSLSLHAVGLAELLLLVLLEAVGLRWSQAPLVMEQRLPSVIRPVLDLACFGTVTSVGVGAGGLLVSVLEQRGRHCWMCGHWSCSCQCCSNNLVAVDVAAVTVAFLLITIFTLTAIVDSALMLS
jgi:hypothetical protein